MDSLTGAWRRAPGLAELQREISRVRRGSGQLVAAYVDVDVDGLKAINDTKGYAAGDAMLKQPPRCSMLTCGPASRSSAWAGTGFSVR